MQTFLPYPDFEATARVLDDRRLGKQRVEALQVLRALRREGYGWAHHPAVGMWRGHETALARYGLTICQVWRERGFSDTVEASILAELGYAAEADVPPQEALGRTGELPPWLGDPDFHRSHQSALVRKDSGRYRDLFPEVPSDLPYVWPVSEAS